jgi:iron complex outermembrane receptor protein
VIKESMNYGGAILLAGSIAVSAAAQETGTAPDTEKMERVVVTGSSIKRIDAETALPVTIIKADEFIQKGMTTVEEMMTSLSMNQQSTVGAANVGAETGGKSAANLRGLGDGRTLILLNGRRLANHPYDASSADLYSIPLAAIDRIEILRDGASHIYGTDAIAGVINFITKRSITDTTVSAEAVVPQQSGAREQRFSLTTGFGDLERDGYNFYGTLDHHEQDRLSSSERAFSASGIIPDKGISKTSGTTFPANFYSTAGITGNPGFASGCLPPFSIAQASNKTCREDYSAFVDDLPETKQTSFFGQASFKTGAGLAVLEYLHSDSTNINRIAPAPETGLIMPSTSKWYPGGSGGTPAVAGLNGENLNISWRTVEAGDREATNLGVSDRLVASLSGTIAGWDLNGALTDARTKVTEDITGGYVNDVDIQNGITNGILNPFGMQDAAGAALLASSQVRGEVVEAVAHNTGIDLHATRDLMQLPAGPLGFSMGLEDRHESSNFILQRGPLDQMLISRAIGLVAAKDTSGARSLSAMFAEVNIPVTRELEAQVAARYDHYSDAGGALSPKIGFRYQPSKLWLLRGSANTGFRAPTLYDLHAPIVDSITSTQYNDPVLCPGGVPKPGVNPNISCNMNLPTRTGGNPDLKPERAKSYSLGLVVEPTRLVTFSVDVSKITVRDEITDLLDEYTILTNYNTYSDRYHYNSTNTALDYINVSSLGNAGERMTQAVDTTMQWRLPYFSFGTIDGWFSGTYIMKDTYETLDGEAPSDLNVYNGVVRWRHNAGVRLTSGAWSTTLSQRYTGSYADQNLVADQYKQNVSPYSVWTLSGSYTGFPHMTLSAGIKNLFNVDPPFSNQTPNSQTGYDPRFADPVGRALYVRASYKL